MPVLQTQRTTANKSHASEKALKRFRAPTKASTRIQNMEAMLEHNDGPSYEIINGELVEQTDMGAKASRINVRMGKLLSTFIDANKLGHVFDSEATYKCFSGPALTIRKPDVSFVKLGRLPNEEIPDGHILIAPDIAVEVISTHDSVLRLEDKIDDYLRAGVIEVWLVIYTKKSVIVCNRNGVRTEIKGKSILTSPELLPGFALKVSEIFE